MLPTKEDIEKCINMMVQEDFNIGEDEAMELAERLKELLTLYAKTVIPVDEVEIIWHSTTCDPVTHTYKVGDAHKDFSNWKVKELRAYLRQDYHASAGNL